MKKRLRKLIIPFIIAGLLFLFNILRQHILPSYKVLKVENADEFYIDLNKNDKIDNNELVKLYDINAFHSEKSYLTKNQIKITGATMPEILALGVIAKDYAISNFTNKTVKVEFFDTELGEKQPYSTAKLYLNNKDVGHILMNEGLATAGKKETDYKNYLNLVNLKKQIEKLPQENIVIVNDQNGTYHHLNCKYAKKLKHAHAMRMENLPEKMKPCPKCILNKDAIKSEPQKPFTTIKNFDFKSGVLSFYFTDFNKRTKPDRDCQNAGCQALLKQINSAKNSIDFAIYGIDNQPKIIDALVSAQKRGVKLRWVTDENTKGENIYSQVADVQKILTDYKTDNPKTHNDSKKDAKYTNSIMHNKFFIFDDSIIWFGSANVSQTDLADFNANIIILANSKTLAGIYKKEFEQMYNEKFHNLKTIIPNKENLKIDDKNTVSVYFSPKDKIITTKIVPEINNARKSICISSFIITHPAIKEALIAAHNHGVEIKIITDATSASGKYSIHKELRAYKIPVKVEDKAGKMHTKSLIIDDIVFVGSMNLTKSGENKNDENMISLYNPAIAQVFREQFLYLWGSIPEKWLSQNPRAEGRDSYGSCSDKIDNDFDGDIDSADDGCKKLKY